MRVCVCVYASSTLAVSNELFKERLRIDQLPLSLILCVLCVFLTIKDSSSKEPIDTSNTHTHFNHKKIPANTMLRCLGDESGSLPG